MTIGKRKYVDPVFVEPDKQQISTVNLQAYKILFVGNSITRHGVCREIGWEYEAGMAASAEKNDYAHRTVALIQEQMPERKVEFYYGILLRKCQSPDQVVGTGTESAGTLRRKNAETGPRHHSNRRT